MYDLLLGIEHVTKQNASTGLINAYWKGLVFGPRFRYGALRVGPVGLWGRIICSRKLPHQCISAVVIEVHTSNICVIKSTCPPTTLVIIAASGTVEGTTCATGLGATAAMAGKGRSLIVALVFLPLEPL